VGWKGRVGHLAQARDIHRGADERVPQPRRLRAMGESAMTQ
jgi:hypothetical protein